MTPVNATPTVQAHHLRTLDRGLRCPDPFRPLMSLYVALVALLLLASGVQAQGISPVRTGTDSFLSGQTVLSDSVPPGDLFASAMTVVLSAPSEGDTHLAGFDPTVDAPVKGEVFAPEPPSP